MGIQSGNTDMRLFNTKLATGIHDEFGYFDNAVLLYTVACLTERAMGGYVNHTQELIGQQHRIFLGSRVMGINLGVTVEIMSGLMQGFFVEGCCHGSVHFVGHGQFDGFDDGNEGGMSALHLYNARLERVHVDAFKVDDIHDALFETGFRYFLDSAYLDVVAQFLGSPLHHFGVARDQRTALFVCFR